MATQIEVAHRNKRHETHVAVDNATSNPENRRKGVESLMTNQIEEVAANPLIVLVAINLQATIEGKTLIHTEVIEGRKTTL